MVGSIAFCRVIGISDVQITEPLPGGNAEYFSVATRLQAALENTAFSDNDHFWVFVASLLFGIFWQKGLPVVAPAMSAKALASHLLAGL